MEQCCHVRRNLAQEFSIAARLYAEAAVNAATLGTSKESHAHLCELAREAQDKSEAAFCAFEKHVDSHRCLRSFPDVLNMPFGRRSA
jgi:hypothetical protein